MLKTLKQMRAHLLLVLFCSVASSHVSQQLTFSDSTKDVVQLNADSSLFTLRGLPYSYNALEPYVDEETMGLHHSKHHQAYTEKLNAALIRARQIQEGRSSRALSTIEGLVSSPQSADLLLNLGQLPEEVRGAVRNHGGGYINHALFWRSMGMS